ncbi:hypothetical protein TSOC_008177 [Tetrabaena socialis]|uniref:MYND-type domain-containing protein n=1 Tax=Tetrabaena socialis TaxID=47790 RepID=A0A2J7ZZ40_9CHLO|nr:hypothetical protein TSOC_008177 [Tetrabaena socialis]|eukprot:PNH05544.1 hypothetical protein TSOC_008177 [Tetrabaena socialis]
MPYELVPLPPGVPPGAVVGRRGRNIKWLRTQSGARITVDNSGVHVKARTHEALILGVEVVSRQLHANVHSGSAELQGDGQLGRRGGQAGLAAAAAAKPPGAAAPFDPRLMFKQDEQKTKKQQASQAPRAQPPAAADAAVSPFDPRLMFQPAQQPKPKQQQAAKQAQPTQETRPELPQQKEPLRPSPQQQHDNDLEGCGAQGQEAESGPQPHHDKNHCWRCAKAKDRAAGVRLQRCSLCLVARYCSPQCQLSHWKQHKAACKLATDAAAAAPEAAPAPAATTAAGAAPVVAPKGRRKGSSKRAE